MEHFGFYSKDVRQQIGQKRYIWIHAVSVGEYLSIVPMVEMLQQCEKCGILVTLTTKSGRKTASGSLPGITKIFSPFDCLPFILMAFRLINPKMIVVVETEIWPMLLYMASKRGVPVILINGRLSPSSLRGYTRYRFVTRRLFGFFSHITMRTQNEAEGVIRLGAKPERVDVSGVMKFDLALSLSRKIDAASVRDRTGISPGKRVIVFGSINPCEEGPLAAMAPEILNAFSDIILVFVPRFLNRTNIYRHLRSAGLDGYVRSSRMPVEGAFSTIVVDTYGVLNDFYSVCEFAFVGGSLDKTGGQNPIEPLAFKKPVLFGKNNWHFAEEWNKIKSGGGGVEVEDFKELRRQIFEWLNNPAQVVSAGEKGYALLKENSGATLKNISVIGRFL